ncbi:hypothetical protein [Hyphomicrobium sp. CS1BSMeth3]|uniref:hypothetical protein n=1 Tax=Hyphomicrobium sp. CS1BSMeth3 TaxID=1892844 RepID=UPI000931309B|nr:hypothetical protein [Hyphomicrobium sp. CS1BSMeth3]
MDRVQRHYAHTALRGTDPLQGLPLDVRRAILTMPPTIRERLRLAPWRTAETRRQALGDIIAERRLAYDLARDTLPTPEPAMPAPEQLSPYYQHRMAMAHLGHQRASDDHDYLDGVRSAEYRQQLAAIPYAKDKDTHAALLKIQIERARLDLAELELHAAAIAKQNEPPAKTPKTAARKPMANIWAEPPAPAKARSRGRDI